MVKIIGDFNQDWQIFLQCNEELELPALFWAALPQALPLSTIHFMIYMAALSQCKPMQAEHCTAYIDNKVILQGAKKQVFTTRHLQEQLKHQLAQAPT